MKYFNGVKASTNTQSTELADKMGLPLNDILIRDEMNELNEYGFYIMNLGTSDNNGWTLLYFHPLQSYYCESFDVFRH
jgi:hypothetical protein